MFDETVARSSKEPENANSTQNQPSINASKKHPSFVPLEQIALRPVEVFQFLHRAPDSVITFHRKREKSWEDLGGMPVAHLNDRFISLQEHLKCDAYFAINSLYPRNRFQRMSDVTGLPLYSRREGSLRWLNVLAVDLDVGHNERTFSFSDLSPLVLSEVEAKGLPRPSLLVSSGRGLWCLWRISGDRDNFLPVRAWPEKVEVYRTVGRQLSICLQDLGADLSVFDGARVMRVPESVNTKAPQDHRRVRFFRLSDECTELALFGELLGIRVQRNSHGSSNQEKNKSEAKVKAAFKRWQNPLDLFEKLREIRGQFQRGVRRPAVYICALLLRRNRYPEAEVRVRCNELGFSCEPPLNASDIKRCISSSIKAAGAPFERSISNRTISRMLRITEGEKTALFQWFKQKEQSGSTKASRRRSLIKQELQQTGQFLPDPKSWIPTRAMSRILFHQHGIKVSHVTVGKDYQHLKDEYFADGEGASVCTSGNFRGP